ncbi:MAG: hypothetical protein AAF941_04810 [Pseudomonadota bacterium]
MTYAKLTHDLVRKPNVRREDADRSSKRRALVLTDEEAQHPFRSNLPPYVKADLHDIPAESLWALTRDDVRGFASTYVAATAAILAFTV